ncbi:hypothetical protein GCM10010168_04430 [Actinoplanes ianthinogenes]|uniref:Uncharacterized protein n=1 Tax=Actinoplanes ianthinogenes TaxID=122358 RepID=A0ABM7LUA8_9ACTN|nr:hypothetical protein [Actinoplanes ianthinogenes]BCJ42817.1 hypothetical protein Aiant_34740 [Actinoplanes ianthinogenes]GGQ92007.1 hypothetical protein GCM10010168_04430 [Actinoplanes ianthinogenes]
MTNRYERLKMHRRMQRRIQLVVEERRMAFAARHDEPVADLETTMEIPPPDLPIVVPQRAIGRVAVPQA